MDRQNSWSIGELPAGLRIPKANAIRADLEGMAAQQSSAMATKRWPELLMQHNSVLACRMWRGIWHVEPTLTCGPSPDLRESSGRDEAELVVQPGKQDEP